MMKRPPTDLICDSSSSDSDSDLESEEESGSSDDESTFASGDNEKGGSSDDESTIASSDESDDESDDESSTPKNVAGSKRGVASSRSTPVQTKSTAKTDKKDDSPSSKGISKKSIKKVAGKKAAIKPKSRPAAAKIDRPDARIPILISDTSGSSDDSSGESNEKGDVQKSKSLPVGRASPKKVIVKSNDSTEEASISISTSIGSEDSSMSSEDSSIVTEASSTSGEESDAPAPKKVVVEKRDIAASKSMLDAKKIPTVFKGIPTKKTLSDHGSSSSKIQAGQKKGLTASASPTLSMSFPVSKKAPPSKITAECAEPPDDISEITSSLNSRVTPNSKSGPVLKTAKKMPMSNKGKNSTTEESSTNSRSQGAAKSQTTNKTNKVDKLAKYTSCHDGEHDQGRSHGSSYDDDVDDDGHDAAIPPALKPKTEPPKRMPLKVSKSMDFQKRVPPKPTKSFGASGKIIFQPKKTASSSGSPITSKSTMKSAKTDPTQKSKVTHITRTSAPEFESIKRDPMKRTHSADVKPTTKRPIKFQPKKTISSSSAGSVTSKDKTQATLKSKETNKSAPEFKPIKRTYSADYKPSHLKPIKRPITFQPKKTASSSSGGSVISKDTMKSAKTYTTNKSAPEFKRGQVRRTYSADYKPSHVKPIKRPITFQPKKTASSSSGGSVTSKDTMKSAKTHTTHKSAPEFKRAPIKRTYSAEVKPSYVKPSTNREIARGNLSRTLSADRKDLIWGHLSSILPENDGEYIPKIRPKRRTIPIKTS
jgi:hypothetical protein